MLELHPIVAELAVGTPRSFVAVGGVPPYSYALISGAGTFDPATMVYTAPDVVPAADAPPVFIEVTDSTGATAESEILVCTPLELLGLIIQAELGLQVGRVYLWDQKINAPTDQGLFVAISALAPKCYANVNRFNPTTEMQEQSSNWAVQVDIDIISRGPEARDRKEEVVMALKSQYSIQQQELNSFSIASITSAIRNLSGIDGTAIPYRFNFSLNLLYCVTKTQPAQFMDTFQSPEITVDPGGTVPVPTPPIWDVANFTVSGATRTTLTAAWDTGAVATAGKLYYGTDPANLDQHVDIPLSQAATSHSVVVTGLTADTDYYFRVDAEDVYGQVHQSLVSTGHTWPIWAISGFSVGTPTTTTMLIAWSTLGFPTGGVVNYGTDPLNLSQQAVDPATGTSHSLVITGLTSNTTYYFQVVATDSYGQTASSTVGSGLTDAAEITSGLVMFLDGTDPSTMTLTGARVDEWRDKLGSGNKLATGFAGTGFNPAYSASLFSNLGGVSFTAGPQKFMETPAAFTTMDWSVGFTVLMAIQWKDKSTFISVSDSARIVAGFGMGQRLGGATFWSSRQGLALNTTVVTGVVYGNPTLQAVFDGALTLPQTGAPSTGTTTFGKLQLGGQQPGSGCTMDVLGFFAYNRTLSPAEIAEMNRWIKTHYSLASPPAPAYNIVVDGDSISVGYVSNGPWMISDGIGDAGISQFDYVNMALNAIATPAMITRAPTLIDPLYNTSFPAKRRIVIANEITNDLAALTQTDVGAYNNIKAYCQARKAVGWKVIVGTCLPRTNAGINANFETYRLSVNTMIRANAIAEGWADAISDIGGDAQIGATGAPNSTTYYNADHIHLNATGHGIAKTYVTAALAVVLA